MDSGETIPEEVCDGLDNDGDQEVDEGFDLNKDGVSDCFQCSVSLSDKIHLKDSASEEACEVTVYKSDFNTSKIEEVWTLGIDDFKAAPDLSILGVCYSPVVIDFDGDGISDVICSAEVSEYRPDSLFVFSGDDGSIIWSSSNEIAGFSTISVGDLNSDGWTDIIGVNPEGYIVAISGSTRARLWTSDAPGASSDADWRGDCSNSSAGYEHARYASTYIFDIDHDGDWEIVTPISIVDASSGYTRAHFKENEDNCFLVGVQRWGFELITGDLTGDGVDEIIIQDRVFNMLGQMLWNADLDPITLNGEEYDLYSSMLIDVDEDPLPEVVFFDYHQFKVYDNDGSLVLSRNIYPSNMPYALLHAGRPCSADLNSDGVSDIIVPTAIMPLTPYGHDETMLTAWTAEGRKLWEQSLSFYGMGECTTFDFDNDGLMEIVVGGSSGVSVLNGQTGETLYFIANSKSLTQVVGAPAATSMFADLDGDGSVEWILASSIVARDEEPAVRVLTHSENAWGPGGRIWPRSNWSGRGMYSNGTPQNDQPDPWISPGRYRSQTDIHIDGSDLRPVLYDSCDAEAESRLSIAVENLGPLDITNAYHLTVVDDAGVEIVRERLISTIPAQSRSATLEVILTPQQALDGVTIRVTPEDDHDCNLGNNAVFWQAGGSVED